MGHGNYTIGKQVLSHSPEEAPCCDHEASVSSVTDRCRVLRGSSHVSEVRPIVNKDSDDSESEIFRVKRRSLAKSGDGDVNGALSVNSNPEVLFTVIYSSSVLHYYYCVCSSFALKLCLFFEMIMPRRKHELFLFQRLIVGLVVGLNGTLLR